MVLYCIGWWRDERWRVATPRPRNKNGGLDLKVELGQPQPKISFPGRQAFPGRHVWPTSEAIPRGISAVWSKK